MNSKNLEKLNRIQNYTGRPLRLMEVCGTHTMQMYKTGIRQLLPKTIRIVSGPGCPVCVTPAGYIDAAASMARMQDVTILTFGDMLRVPGLKDSLEKARSEGARIKILLSPLEAVQLADENRSERFMFLAVGFETTTPATALAVKHAELKGIANLFFFLAHKTMPMALNHLIEAKHNIDAFIYPGHVAAITGMAPFTKLTDRGVSGVVAGFEAEELIEAIDIILAKLKQGKPFCVNGYRQVVHEEGNTAAQKLVGEVFEPCDALWRGLGNLPGSGLKFNDQYQKFDAGIFCDCAIMQGDREGCMCAEVLTGEIAPDECTLFGRICNPANPVGACMVSSEGSCAAAYRYRPEGCK